MEEENKKGQGPVKPVKKFIGSILDAPIFLKVEYILSGYRCNYEAADCFKSALAIHNETVNIWTHLVGSVSASLILLFFASRYSEHGLMHVFMPSVYFIGCVFGLGASAVFHWFNCISADVHRHLRTIDFSGIGVVCFATSWPITYYAFYCKSEELTILFALMIVASPIVVLMPVIQCFHDNKVLRSVVYVFSASIPFFVMLQLYYFQHRTDLLVLDLMATGLLFGYFCFGMGLFLYITKIPERFWPGAFDLLGTSHQIWHCLVLIGMTSVGKVIIELVEYRLATNTCNI